VEPSGISITSGWNALTSVIVIVSSNPGAAGFVVGELFMGILWYRKLKTSHESKKAASKPVNQ
jgi:hypothetical protein